MYIFKKHGYLWHGGKTGKILKQNEAMTTIALKSSPQEQNVLGLKSGITIHRFSNLTCFEYAFIHLFYFCFISR